MVTLQRRNKRRRKSEEYPLYMLVSGARRKDGRNKNIARTKRKSNRRKREEGAFLLVLMKQSKSSLNGQVSAEKLKQTRPVKRKE